MENDSLINFGYYFTFVTQRKIQGHSSLKTLKTQIQCRKLVTTHLNCYCTPQMCITYTLYHHKGIPTPLSRILPLHGIADANMGKSVGSRAPVQRLHATLMLVHFSIGWSAVRPLRRGWCGGCYTVLLVGSLRPRVSSP